MAIDKYKREYLLAKDRSCKFLFRDYTSTGKAITVAECQLSYE
jgi:hypothetical protein